MKVNSINLINTYSKPSFKHTAVPYPEYANAYKNNDNNGINSLLNKISSFFTPQVTNEAKEIKEQINNIYTDNNTSAKKHLMSVFA